MSKLQELRQAVLAAATDRPLEADQVFTYVDRAKVSAGPNHLRYTGTVLVFVLEVIGEAHAIVKALSDYLREYEPGAEYEALEFDVEMIDHKLYDMKFTLPYTENVIFDGAAFFTCDGKIPNPDSILPK